MKRLKIHEQEGEFVIERINQFDHATKRHFISEQGLIEALQSYPDLEEYEIETDASLWAVIINALKNG